MKESGRPAGVPRELDPPLAAHSLLRLQSAALEAAEDGVAIFTADGRLAYHNSAFLRLHGYSESAGVAETAAGDGLAGFFSPDERARLGEEIIPSALRSGRWHGESTGLRASGESFDSEVTLTRMEDGSIVAVVRDVSRRRLEESAARDRAELYRLLAQNSNDIVALHARDGSYLYVSPSAHRILGYDQHELLGRDPWSIVHSTHGDRVREAFERAAEGERARVSYRIRTRHDEFIWFETSVSPVEPGAGAATLQSASRDISERKRFERQLAFRALHDPLTGLPNRALFLSQLKKSLARAERDGDWPGVMVGDLNGFKLVNDTLGHAAGDAVLVEVAERLLAAVREMDTVARLGGDEFAILLDRIGEADDAGRVFERIQAAFPIRVGDHAVDIALGLARAGPGEKTESILRRADHAMYERKRGGASDPKTDSSSDSTERITGEALRAALLEGGPGLALRYQPMIDLTTGRIEAVEALLRWRGDPFLPATPQEILHLAQREGLGGDLTGWIVSRASRRMREWGERGLAPGRMAINLSGAELRQPDLVDRFGDAVEASGVSPSEFSVEVDEQGAVGSDGPLLDLASSGVRISVERMGVGGTPLRALSRLPVELLKLDRSLVSGSGREENRDVVRSVVRIGDALGIQVSAVGIESSEDETRLREFGCRSGQGYYLARPQGAARIERLLAGAKPRPA